MKKTCCLITVLTLLFILTACGNNNTPTTPPTIAESICESAPEQTVTQPTEAGTVPATEPATDPQPVLSSVEVWREGQATEVPVQIVTGTVGTYTIAMDPEYFSFIPQQTADLFSYAGWTGDQAVYYAVSAYRGGYDPGKFESDVLAQFESRYENWYSEETTLGQYPATLVCMQNQLDEPAYFRYLYLVDCGSNCYLIEAEVYAEMFDGLYPIMRACFDTFTVIS